MPAARTAARDLTAEVAFLTRALKAPALRESVPRLAQRARAESWSHEEFLIACLQREVAARALRQDRLEVIRPAAGTAVEVRRLADYDTALGIDGGAA